MGDLFDVRTTQGFDKNKLEFSDDGAFDFIGRSDVNYGIQGKLDKLNAPANPACSFSLIQIGNTMALWRETSWYASQNLFLLMPKCTDMVNNFLYLQGAINKAMSELYGRDYVQYPTLKSLQNDMVYLPIQTDAAGRPVIDPAKTYHLDGFVPDWDYMAAYIRAVEKLVIKDVVDFKDAFISKAKEAVGA